MRFLILVRHGRYNYTTGSLIADGRGELVVTGNALKTLIEGLSVTFLAADSRRGKESGEVLSRVLGLPYQEQKLFSAVGEYLAPGQLAQILTIIAECQTEVLLAVTHEPVMINLPDNFAHQVGISIWDWPKVGKGQALVIDCEQKTARKIPA
jgi:phosphohistidine phosphatase SixA